MDPYLILSLVALAAGPPIARLSGRSSAARSGLHAFVQVTILALVFAQIVPHSIALAGPSSLFIALVGLAIPPLLHRAMHATRHADSFATAALVTVALAVHAIIDGLGLAVRHADPRAQLAALAIVLHQLPMSIAVWWVGRGRIASSLLIAMLVLLGLGTVAGWWLGQTALRPESAWGLGALQALLAGSLLHVVSHHGPDVPNEAAGLRGRVVGAGLGGALVLFLTVIHPPLEELAELARIEGGAADATLHRIGMALAVTVVVASVAFALWPRKQRHHQH